jgi:hypothetical protein
MNQTILQKVMGDPCTKKFAKREKIVICWRKYGKIHTKFDVWQMNKGEFDSIEQFVEGDMCGMDFSTLCKVKEYQYYKGNVIWTRDSSEAFSLTDLCLDNFDYTKKLQKTFEIITNPTDGNTYINHYNLFCESMGEMVIQGDIDEIRILKIDELVNGNINIIRKDFLHNIIETEKSDVDKYKVYITNEKGEMTDRWEPYDIDYLTMIQYV